MKKLVSLIVLITCLSVASLTAQNQNDERRTVVDSMTVSMLKRPSMQRMFAMALEKSVDASVVDAIFVEYMTFRLASNLLYDAVADISDSDLRRMKSLMCSRFYDVLMSHGFWSNYAMYMYRACQVETGQINDFSYKFNDVRFNELAKAVSSQYHSFVENMEEVTTLSLSAVKGLNESVITRVKDAVPYILIHSLMDYFSYEELASVDFGAFDLLDFVGKLNLATAFNDSTVITSRSSDILASSDLLDNVSRYVMEYRQGTASVSLKTSELKEVPMKKYKYSGPVRDGLPHGKGGMMTDSKGVTYVGDFRNGQRHGLIMMTKPGKATVPQVWIKDRLQKNMPATADNNGLTKAPGVYEGRYFGYGRIYDDSKTIKEGFFIDGKLSGKGRIESQTRVLEGNFLNGELTQGTIKWKTADWKIKEFSGICSGEMLNGSMQYVSNDGKYRKISRGTFVNEYLEGRGVVHIRTQKYEMVRDGVFVKGIMFGEGKVIRTLKTTKEGVNEKQVYNGWLAKGVPHGNGVVKISYTDMPDKVIRMSRYGVKIAPSGPGFAEIVMEGRFADGKLIEGKVKDLAGMLMEGTFKDGVLAKGRMVKTYSDGSSYDGECLNGKFHGHGKLVYADGTVYEGLFENGYRVDTGTDPMIDFDVVSSVKPSRSPKSKGETEKVYRFDNLRVQSGVASLVRAAGVKILVRNISAVEVVCTGEFDGDIFKRGKVEISDGNWMEGEFEDGVLIRGRARTEDKYGTIYVGDIMNGMSHGKGKCTYKNGTWFEGNFAKGNRMDGTHYTADGRVIKVYK